MNHRKVTYGYGYESGGYDEDEDEGMEVIPLTPRTRHHDRTNTPYYRRTGNEAPHYQRRSPTKVGGEGGFASAMALFSQPSPSLLTRQENNNVDESQKENCVAEPSRIRSSPWGKPQDFVPDTGLRIEEDDGIDSRLGLSTDNISVNTSDGDFGTPHRSFYLPHHRKLSPQASSIASFSLASVSSRSNLMGESILPPLNVESRPKMLDDETPPASTEKRVSFDIERGQQVPERRLSEASTSRTAERLQNWGRTVQGEFHRVSARTSSEFAHLKRVTFEAARATSGAAQRVFPIQKVGHDELEDDWYDLDYLQRQHEEKMKSLTNVVHEESYDFVLVLQPQEVYAFWSEHLDFRAELLDREEEDNTTKSPESGTVSPSSTVDTSPSDASIDSPLSLIDARPFMTPHASGIRRRKSRPEAKSTTPLAAPDIFTTPVDSERQKASRKSIFSGGFMCDLGSEKRVVKPRLSLFEKAVGVLSPSRTSSSGKLPLNSTTPMRTTPASTTRRRWGNQKRDLTPNVFSPRPLSRSTSKLGKRSVSHSNTRSSTSSEDKSTDSAKRRRKNEIRPEDIPEQVIPRGIAARTNGMLQFLNALKRGIVVRRHRPGAEAVFCKIFSTDGGDTIKYEYVDTDDAMQAFKEQRVRYNRPKKGNGSKYNTRSISKTWSHRNLDDDDQNTFTLPDFIAARQYRKKRMSSKGARLKSAVEDAATKAKNSGMIKAVEMIAIHPARHRDPRSPDGELGTGSLRRSVSEYYGPNTFSIISRAHGALLKKIDTKEKNTTAAEKWYSGEGNDANFKYLDFEAATEGEYWLIFRGLLLLHRDIASGRFAAQRARGFGSNYNDDTEEYNILQKNSYHEPPTVGLVEKIIAQWRGVDTSYMLGSAEPEAKPPPSDYFLGFRSPGTQIWSRLRNAGLQTTRIYALNRRRVMIKVRCPSDRLMDVAEVLRIKVKTHDGAFEPFKEINAFAYATSTEEAPGRNLDLGRSIFRSSERQAVIDFIIRSRLRDSGAELGQSTDLGKLIQNRNPLHVQYILDRLYDSWFHFWRISHWSGRPGTSMISGRFLESLTRSERQLSIRSSDDDRSEAGTLTGASRRPPNVFSRFFVGMFFQPLDSVEQYFGEKVAFYFAWLQHCATHLMFLSVAGLIVFLCMLSSGNWDHPIRPFFSVVVMLWSFTVLVNWRKRSNLLAYRWGTMDYKEQETTRPQFTGDDVQDPLTKEWIVYYPSWKRWLKYLISFPLTVAFTVCTLIVILLVHANRDIMLARYFEEQNGQSKHFNMTFSISAISARKPMNSVEITAENLQDPNFWIITAGLPAALGLCLPLLNFILMRISIALNEFENYRTESEYRTFLIIKVFSFRFVCYFATLYYYAFMSIGSQEQIEAGIVRIGAGVFIYMTVTHWWGVIIQTWFPLLIYKWRMYRQRRNLMDSLMQVELEEAGLQELSEEEAQTPEARERKRRLVNKRLLLDQAQDSLWAEVMMPKHDSFPEYIQAVVQFAYVTCFSVVLPITPIICLLNHLLSMRLDAYKVCRGRCRPLAQKTGGIGVWEHVLHIVTVIAVLTNCWLMGFTHYQFTWLTEKVGNLGLFAIIVGWEHIMLLIKYVMQTSISPFPKVLQDKFKLESHKDQVKRSTSLRTKKDRRSQFRKNSDDTSTGTVSPIYRGARDVFRTSLAQEASSQRLKTILSEESDTAASPVANIIISPAAKINRKGNQPSSQKQAGAVGGRTIDDASPWSIYLNRSRIGSPNNETPILDQNKLVSRDGSTPTDLPERSLYYA